MSDPSSEAQQSSAAPKSVYECQGCSHSSPSVSYCSICGLSLCDGCWDGQLVHKPGFIRPGSKAHEKIDPLVAQQINNVFSGAQDVSTSQQLHSDDEKSAWFGIEQSHDGNQSLLFRDYGRFSALMAKSDTIYRRFSSKSSSSSSFFDPTERSPSLISFVGQTGAGKSTLIKLLLESHSSGLSGPDSSPVIGVVGKHVPTSEHVHLYADPTSSLSQSPLLYADCEGLGGGEREPVAASLRTEKWQRKHEHATTFPQEPYCIEREIHWAKSRAHRTRNFAVSSFYPRVLFTFSDVVVFVHRNARSVEPVLEKLIEWAETALETSSNQPILPVAILALNAFEDALDSTSWDPDLSTKALLDSLASTVDRNVTFAKYAELWRSRGRNIESVEQLFLCYFSSFKVIHIPTNAHPGRLHDQIRKLYTELQNGSQTVRERKLSLRMLLNSYELRSYLQDAFEHFSRSIDAPFDFVQASFANRSIPTTFGGNILQLTLAMMKQESRPDARAILDKLSFFLASCIMLDAVRNSIKGTAEHIFPHYLEHLDTALEEFCDNHWPCEYAARGVIDPHLLETHRSDMWIQRAALHRCVNVRNGHSTKGHQMQDGHIFAYGPYEAKFTFSTYREEFRTAVYTRLRCLLERLAELEISGETQEVAALQIHRDDILRFFYRKTGAKHKRTMNLKMCLSCLFNPPEHALSCGHVLCTACAKGYGRSRGKNTIQILECPLDDLSKLPCRPQVIHLKPESAGVRILTLDDGGIRSFLQLKTLRLIENEFGGRLSIQHLFDLVVGKGAGSIIALHLANHRWTSGSCSTHLERICREGFNRSQLKILPSISRTHGFFPKHRYHSKGLQAALKNAFTEKRTLLDTSSGQGAAIRAAVVAGGGGSPVVFTNYRYSTPIKLAYDVYWPEDPEKELAAWEVVRASMAHSNYFKPYKHPTSDSTFYDNGLYQHSLFDIAMSEQKRTFQTHSFVNPDILLSLGSGYEPERRDSAQPSQTTKNQRSGGNAEDASRESWQNFLLSLPTDAPLNKFVRIDPAITHLPARDDLDSLEFLQSMTESYFNTEEIRNIAFRLFANLFYFEEAEQRDKTSDDDNFLQGSILCRLPVDTIAVREVGKLLQTSKFAGAFFVVQGEGIDNQQFQMPESTIEGMIKTHQFQMPSVQIRATHKPKPIDIMLQLPTRETYSISGFPRLLHNRFRKSISAGGLTSSRRSSWQPPSKERLASIDLGPLKSPMGSSSSYRSLSKRSASSINSTNREPDMAEPSLGLESPLNSRKPVQTEQNQARIRNPLKVSFGPLLDDSEAQTTIAERRATRGSGKTKGAGLNRGPLQWPLRKVGKEEKRMSESSEDEIFGQIINSPTVR